MPASLAERLEQPASTARYFRVQRFASLEITVNKKVSNSLKKTPKKTPKKTTPANCFVVFFSIFSPFVLCILLCQLGEAVVGLAAVWRHSLYHFQNTHLPLYPPPAHPPFHTRHTRLSAPLSCISWTGLGPALSDRRAKARGLLHAVAFHALRSDSLVRPSVNCSQLFGVQADLRSCTHPSIPEMISPLSPAPFPFFVHPAAAASLPSERNDIFYLGWHFQRGESQSKKKI